MNVGIDEILNISNFTNNPYPKFDKEGVYLN